MRDSLTNEPAQVRFWRGEFGDAYTERSAPTAERLRARTALWSNVLRCVAGAPPASILEVGANLGINLRVLRTLTDAEFFAVEPNARARKILVRDGVVPATNVSDDTAARIHLPDGAVDMVFTSGVLIHVHPNDLLSACREIHRVARRYVISIEYFADKPEEVEYRGHSGNLFKRDFGGFWLDQFPNLRVLDYGFAWKRLTGIDNVTWWVFEKYGYRP